MNDRLDVAKVVYGAFLVPWINRQSFARALAIPVGILATLTLCSYYLGGHVPQAFHWLLTSWPTGWCLRGCGGGGRITQLVLLDSARIGVESASALVAAPETSF